MKRHNKHIIFLGILIILFTSMKAISQESNWHKSLLKLLKTDQYHKMENFQKTEKFNNKQEKHQHAIHNINEYLKQAAKLRAQGKTAEEIRAYFDAQREILGTGSISGMVYESDGVTPIQQYVRVRVFNEYGKYGGSDYVSSWDNGVYTVTELGTGDYYVSLTSDDYIDEYYNNVTDWQDATLVHEIDGQETGGINFSLDSIPEYNGAISGYVFGTANTPLSDCGIAVYDQDENLTGYGFSNASGYYVTTGLPTGNYRLYAVYEGTKNYIGEWYKNAQSFDSATDVSVTEPDTTKGINFTLEPGCSISGRVTKADGQPVGYYDCEVNAYSTDLSQIYYTESGETDDNGNYKISNLPSGEYKLEIYYYGRENYLDVWYDGAENFEDATPISVTAPDSVANINIILPKGGAISGQVFGPDGQPLEDGICSVAAYDENQIEVEDCYQRDGSYLIDKLPGGQYKLFAEFRSMYSDPIFQTPASEWYDGVYNFDEATFVQVTTADSVTNIDFTLEAGGTITGKVYGPENQLLSYSGNVEAYDSKGQLVREGENSGDGTYFIAGLPTGEYKLQFLYEGEQNYSDEWYDGKTNSAAANTISVTAQQTTSNIDFTLESAAIIQGLVIDAPGKRLTEDDYFINILIYDAISGDFVESDMNSFIEGYQFELLGRDYKLQAVSYYLNSLPSQDSLAVSYYNNGTSFSDPNTQTISLLPDSTLTLNDLVMEKASGSISGTIYYSYGDIVDPMSFGIYYFFVFDEGGYLVKVSAYSEEVGLITGEYVLSGLRPGKYYVMASIGLFLFLSQWYDGVEVDIKTLNSFSIKIPSSASAITVGEGEISGIDFIFDFSTDVEQQAQKIPQDFKLTQNYPNPFNPITTIEYQLPQPAYVEIYIYNVLGQKVATLVKGQQSIGLHSVKWDAHNIPSGIYFYRIEAGKFKQTRKCLLLK